MNDSVKNVLKKNRHVLPRQENSFVSILSVSKLVSLGALSRVQ